MLAMGGYGLYIWPCYVLVLGGMLMIVTKAALKTHRIKKTIKQKL